MYGSRNDDIISKDIKDFTPVFENATNASIRISIPEIEVINDNSIFGYAYLINGKVKSFSKDTTYTFEGLTQETEYNIQVVAMDENWKAKYSGIIRKKTAKSEYVNDGLIFQLDGITNTLSGHSNETTTWYDLSGNGKHCTIYNCTINSDNIGFNGSNSRVILPTNVFDNLGNVSTFEIVAKVDKSRGIILGDKNTYDRGFFVYDNVFYPHTFCSGRSANGYTSVYPNFSFGNKNLYTIIYNLPNVNAIYTNNMAAQKSNKTEYWAHDTYNVLGTRYYGGFTENGGAAFQGSIYAIRVYNRALTADEMKQNYLVDKERFGIQ